MELLRPGQNVLQRRRCFSEPLVARRRSVVKRLRLRCGAFETTGRERVGRAKIPGLKNPGGYAAMAVTINVCLN